MSVLVKLCGLRDADDARAAVRAGADQVGIVCVPGAGRYVAVPTVAGMVRAVREEAQLLGRFAPAVIAVLGRVSAKELLQVVELTMVDGVQLVGDEDQARSLAGALREAHPTVSVTRTLGVGHPDCVPVLLDVADHWEARGARIVFDAALPGALGGTGVRLAMEVVRPLMTPRRGLAGGLEPENVALAIRDLHPGLVDVSSGIEDDDGANDLLLMQAFVAAARAALLEPLPPDQPPAPPPAGRTV